MFPVSLPYKLLGATFFIALVGIVSGLQGYKIGKGKIQKEFDLYKAQVEVTAKQQEVKNNEIFDAQRKTNIAAADEYRNSIAAIRKSFGLRGTTSGNSSNQVSPISTSTPRLSENPADPSTARIKSFAQKIDDDALLGLAEACTETTQQLESFQKWYLDQEKIYNEGIK